MTVRVAVTTSADRAAGAARCFRAAGLDPVVLPCIRVVAADVERVRALREAAEGGDLLVLTSGRPLDILWPEGRMPPLAVAAVGPATARRAERWGARVVTVGTRGGADLADRIRGGRKVVVYPHAEGTDGETIRLLEAAAERLLAAPVYRTDPVPPADDPVEAAAFASPSAVEGWVAGRSLERLVVAVIGATTAGAVARFGRKADVIASRPGYEALAEALAAHVEETR